MFLVCIQYKVNPSTHPQKTSYWVTIMHKWIQNFLNDPDNKRTLVPSTIATVASLTKTILCANTCTWSHAGPSTASWKVLTRTHLNIPNCRNSKQQNPPPNNLNHMHMPCRPPHWHHTFRNQRCKANIQPLQLRCKTPHLHHNLSDGQNLLQNQDFLLNLILTWFTDHLRWFKTELVHGQTNSTNTDPCKASPCLSSITGPPPKDFQKKSCPMTSTTIYSATLPAESHHDLRKTHSQFFPCTALKLLFAHHIRMPTHLWPDCHNLNQIMAHPNQPPPHQTLDFWQ